MKSKGHHAGPQKVKTAGKPRVIRFDLPDTSSDGGLLVLEKAERRLGLVERLAQVFPQKRAGSRHSAAKMLMQRVFGICQGWEDCNDFDRLRSDPLLCHVLGSLPASQPTLSRFENSVDSKQLMRLSLEMVRVFVERHRAKPPRTIVIDMDATDDPAHGQQEFEFFHGFYGRHCFLPLLVFCSADGGDEELVGALLRPGRSHAGRRSASVLRRLAILLKEAFPGAEVRFRADGGFALPEVYDACESLGLSYLISLPQNHRLRDEAEPVMKEARRLREPGGRARLFDSFSYAAESWPHERRVILKAEVMEKGDNQRFVLTNRTGDPQALYEEYAARGDSENRIKELKIDLFSGRTSCHRFAANAFRLLLHAFAFVLLSEVRRLLEQTPLARSTMGQIRLKLLKAAAQVTVSTRRVLVRLARGHPHAGILCALLA